VHLGLCVLPVGAWTFQGIRCQIFWGRRWLVHKINKFDMSDSGRSLSIHACFIEPQKQRYERLGTYCGSGQRSSVLGGLFAHTRARFLRQQTPLGPQKLECTWPNVQWNESLNPQLLNNFSIDIKERWVGPPWYVHTFCLVVETPRQVKYKVTEADGNGDGLPCGIRPTWNTQEWLVHQDYEKQHQHWITTIIWAISR
jgi:hypothetical protein